MNNNKTCNNDNMNQLVNKTTLEAAIREVETALEAFASDDEADAA